MESMKTKLLAIVIGLFHKMVEASQPFHLTLLSVCFSKFKEHAVCGTGTLITNYFQIKSECSREEVEGRTTEQPNKESVSKLPLLLSGTNKSISPQASETLHKTLNRRSSAIKPSTISYFSQDNILDQKSVTKQTKRKHQGIDDLKIMTEHKKIKQCLNQHNPELPFDDVDNPGRSDDDFDTVPEDSNKVIKNCPASFDPEVFFQLPQIIQKELLQSSIQDQIFEGRSVDTDKNKCISAGASQAVNNEISEPCYSSVKEHMFPDVQKSESHKTQVLHRVDPSVFSQLPADIQQEIIASSKATMFSNAKKIQPTGKGKASNILKYFRKV